MRLTNPDNPHKSNAALTRLMAVHKLQEAKHRAIANRHLEERRALLREIGDELKAIRTKAGITLVAMANLLKVSRGCLNAAESPVSVSRYLSPETVFSYAEAYEEVAQAMQNLNNITVPKTKTKKQNDESTPR